MSKRYVVSLTMDEAKKLGIVHCANCGWPPNNHWNDGPVNVSRGESACAHDKCPGYEPKFKMGKAVP
jgi:hypothetical protein